VSLLKIANKITKSYFGGSRSFKVVDVDTPKKLITNACYYKQDVCSRSFKVIDVDKSEKPVTSACYDVQYVCAYLQPFSRYAR